MMAEHLVFWHWWILGAIFIILEIFAPGAFFLWMGIAAGVVGAVLYAIPGLSWEYQLIIFSILSVASIVLWKRYAKKHPPQTDQPSLNRRGTQYIGRIFTLEAPIVNGIGKIRVDDTTWKVNGADCPAGTHVEVVGIRGTVLQVEPRKEHEGMGQRPVSTT